MCCCAGSGLLFRCVAVLSFCFFGCVLFGASCVAVLWCCCLVGLVFVGWRFVGLVFCCIAGCCSVGLL